MAKHLCRAVQIYWLHGWTEPWSDCSQNASEFQTWKSRPQLIHMQYAMLNEASGSSDAPRLAKWQSIVMALQLSEEQKERLLAARTYLLAQMMEIIQERTLIISMLQVQLAQLTSAYVPYCVLPCFRLAPACELALQPARLRPQQASLQWVLPCNHALGSALVESYMFYGKWALCKGHR